MRGVIKFIFPAIIICGVVLIIYLSNFDSLACFSDNTKVAGHFTTEKDPLVSKGDFEVPAIEVVQAWAQKLNAFTLAIEKIAIGEQGNGVLSAYSVHSALSMTAAGARGSTYDEMAEVLSLGDDRERAAKLNGAMRNILRFDGQAEGSELNIANRLWVEQSLQVEGLFADTLAKDYLAALQRVDFKNNFEKVVDIINKYVENNTGGMIRELLSPAHLTDTTKLVLVNAIYFSARWFDDFSVSPDGMTFHAIDGRDKKMDAIYTEANMGFAELKEIQSQAIRINYQGWKFHLLIVMPDSNDSFKSLHNTLDAAQVVDIKKRLQRQKVDLTLPKIKIESDIPSMPLVLEKLGIQKAFSVQANFEGISKRTNLSISNIIHKAVVEWDEHGTKAAAATAVIVEEGAAVAPTSPRVVKIDKPFRFMIIHNASGAIIFSGQYVK